jgi:uncharacterized protein YggU (UPF0235/DUF167 family)
MTIRGCLVFVRFLTAILSLSKSNVLLKKGRLPRTKKDLFF